MAAIPSQENLPDTPPSRQSASVRFDYRAYKVEDIIEAVKNETMHAFTTVNVDDFMESIFRSSSLDIKAILGELETAQFYVDNKWADLPQHKAKNNDKFHETDLYAGWVKIASKVNDIIREKHSAARHGIEGKWIDCNHVIPKSKGVAPSSLRPDIAFVSVSAKEELIKECNEALHKAEAQQLQGDKKLDSIISQLWWLQMIGFGEFKVKKEAKEEAFLQLCNYVKQAFREQLDRRFIIAFTLCHDDLNIYLFDRSGVVGVENTINIHKNPEQLIKLIACYTVLESEKIGFDPTMKVYSKNVGNPRSSWTMPLPNPKDQPDLYECQWVIKIAGVEHTTEYITIRTLSLINAEMMCGRATIVWEVVRYEDFKQGNKDAEVFVLKQSWQRTPGLDPHDDLSTIPFESVAHSRADIASTRLQEAVYVKSEDDKIISTMGWIRDGLTGALHHVSWLSGGASNKQSNIRPTTDLQVSSIQSSRSSNPSSSHHISGTSEGRKRPRNETLDPGEREPFQHQGSLPALDPNFEERAKPVDRKQTRILMKTRGWGLKNFKSLEELLWVFHDAIDDHKQFYYRGVLHRDISVGNIVILNPRRDGKIGRLIDLDHAKMNKHVDEKREPLKDDFTEDELRSRVDTIMTVLARRRENPVFVDELTATAASKKLKDEGKGIMYLGTIAERFKIASSKKEPIKLSDLHWDLPVEIPPSFENYSAGDGVRTGTLPYISHQIIGRVPATHDAIHDIESFFWVMVYMALSRIGPGAKDLKPRHNLLESHFNDKSTSGLALAKGSLFSTRDEVAKTSMEELFKGFHSYFEGLKPFIEKWQKVIQTAYQFEAFELHTIHEYTKTLIKEAITTLTANPSPELTQEEDDRREAYNRDTQIAIQANISAPAQQVTPEKPPRRTTNAQPEEPESPTRIPTAKKLRSGKQ